MDKFNSNEMENEQSNQQLTNQQYQGQPNHQQQYGNQPYGNQQYQGQPNNQQQYGNQPYGYQQYNQMVYPGYPGTQSQNIANSDVHQLGRKPRGIVSWAFFSLFLLAAVVLGSQIVIEFLVSRFWPELANTNWFIWVETLLSLVVIGLPIYILLIRKLPDSPKSETEHMSPYKFIIIFLICTAAMYISNLFTVVITLIISLIKGKEMINPLAEAMTGSNFIIMIIYASIVAPIVEELIFRKYLLNKLRRFGDVPAILMTGIAFGLFHFNLSQFFYAAVLGCIFAYVAIRTNTIKYNILLHMMINLIGTIVTPLVTTPNIVGILGIVVWEIVAITLGSIFFFVFIKKIKLQKVQPTAMKGSYYFLNPGVLLYTILALILIALATLA